MRAFLKRALLAVLCVAQTPAEPAFAQVSVDSAARGVGGKALVTAQRAMLRTKSVPRVCWAGDSQFDFARNSGTNILQSTNIGIPNWARLLSMGSFYTDNTLNFAVAGMRTDYLPTELVGILAARCDIVVDDIGTNDVGTNTAAVATANLKTFWSALNAAGIAVIELTIPPQTSWSTPYRQVAQEINRQKQLAALDATRNVRLVDIVPYVIDYGSGNILSGFTFSDGVHLTPSAAIQASGPVLAAIKAASPGDPTVLPYSATDAYDATLNPTGSLMASIGMLSGTGGSLTSSPTGATGTCATGWNCGFGSTGGTTTATVAFSKGADATFSTLPTEIMTLGGIADSNNFVIDTAPTSLPITGIAAGDTIFYQCVISFSGLSNIKGVQLFGRVYDNGTLMQNFDGAPFNPSGTSSVALPASSITTTNPSGKLLYTSRPYTIVTSLTQLRMAIQVFPLNSGTAIAGTVTVQQCQAHKALTGTGARRLIGADNVHPNGVFAARIIGQSIAASTVAAIKAAYGL